MAGGSLSDLGCRRVLGNRFGSLCSHTLVLSGLPLALVADEVLPDLPVLVPPSFLV
jgi:hypothetical protein